MITIKLTLLVVLGRVIRALNRCISMITVTITLLLLYTPKVGHLGSYE